jgi:2-iminobutanoate/2-iminopropanoate deaminase
MKSVVINTKLAPEAIGPYSQGIVSNGVAYLSGQIPLDPATGQIVPGDIVDQTKRVLDNLGAVLKAAGSGYDHVLKTTVYLADLNDFAKMNEVYGQYFTSQQPARATVQVARLPRDSKVEIDCIAEVA